MFIKNCQKVRKKSYSLEAKRVVKVCVNTII
jgi:hypothetical protein